MRNLVFGGAPLSGVWPNVGLAILRVFSGMAMALAHGLGKIPPSAGFINATAEMGFPFPGLFAWLAGLSEFGGGLLLALGALTRPAALFVGITMAVAAFIRHAPDPFGRKELALLYLAIMVALVLIGAGRYSVDDWLRRRREDKTNR